MCSKNIKAKNMMYTQQISHLPLGTIDKLQEQIEKLSVKKYALIVHDKDVDEKGNLVESHVHLMLSFRNARSCNNVAHLLGDQGQYMEAWKGEANNGYAYLVHATKQAKDKYQYSSNEVIANFDYAADLNAITVEVSNAKRSSKAGGMLNTLLDALYIGGITKKELEERLTGSQIAKARRQIEDVWAKRLEKSALQWREEMKRNHRQVKVVWIYGEAGTGKSSLAKEYAKRNNQDFYMSGSSRDVFQNYSGEHVLVLDEFRPTVLPYHDLLRITDPFSNDASVMLPSRYNDKALACELIIITSPFNPIDFYREIFGNGHGTSYRKTNIDSFEQLNRRISLVIEMNQYWINPMKYNEKFEMYEQIAGAGKKNTYSSMNYVTSKVDSVQLFKEMFKD